MEINSLRKQNWEDTDLFTYNFHLQPYTTKTTNLLIIILQHHMYAHEL